MKKNLLLIVLALTSLSYTFAQGNLLIIGGGRRGDAMMNKFVQLAGGVNAGILIIPNASGNTELAGSSQEEEFLDMGCNNVRYIVFDKHLVNSDSLINSLSNIKGVFICGGDQSILSKLFVPSKFLDFLKKVYKDGGVIAGTSAGAAIMSKVMITGNEKINQDSTSYFHTIMPGNVETIEGFGFLKDIVIDQHFIIRKRLNRLISVILEKPELLGIGIDESTAILVKPDYTMEIVGDRTVVIVDASKTLNVSTNDIGLYAADNISLSILKAGDKFDLKKRIKIGNGK